MQTQGNAYLSDKQLAARFGVARGTIWRWIRTADFPKPKKISVGCSRWFLPDVEKWENSRPQGV
jgi:prophage regulatory protein